MEKRLNILVVDDDKMMIKTITDILTLKGYTVISALNAHHGIEIIQTSEIDCLITDIKMPGMDGVEFSREVRNKFKNLPIVLMTAFSHDNLVSRGLKEGALAVLHKPINLTILMEFLSFLKKDMALVIVDDDKDFCKTFYDLLVIRNYSVKYYSDHLEVENKSWEKGEILILDLRLKGTTGYEVMKNARKNHPYLPVILVTGDKTESQPLITLAINESAYTCLFKPFDFEELVNTIDNLYKDELRKLLGVKVHK